MMDESFWKDIINGLNLPNLPDMPIIEEEFEEEPEEIRLELKEASILRLKFDIYLISPLDDEGKAYMVNSGQRLEDMGIMKVGEALAIIKRRNQK